MKEPRFISARQTRTQYTPLAFDLPEFKELVSEPP